MDIYTPFTYIIGWSKQNKFYYGAKYAQGCQPSDLWKTYFTSSEYVKDFREEFGEPDIIKIHRTFSDADSCVLFEHNYLNKINAKNNPTFLNKSNGGKKFAILNEDVKNKTKQTCLEKYGYECALQVPTIREKGKQTKIKKYNNENYNNIEKHKNTKQEKYGNENYNNRQKSKETCLKIYGVDNINKVPEIREKSAQTISQKYNISVINIFQIEEIKNKSRQTCLEKYGVDNISKYPENKKIISEKTKLQRANEPKLICPHCGLEGKGPNMKRYHFDNCRKISL